MKFLDRINQWISHLLLAIAGAALVSIVLLVFINIVLRQFHASFGGVPEIVGWLTAVVISFSLAYAQQSKAHIDLDLLVNALPGIVQRLLAVVVALASLLFFAMVAWQLFAYAESIMSRGALSQTLNFAYYPFVYAVAIGMGAFCLVLLSDFFHRLLAVFKP